MKTLRLVGKLFGITLLIFGFNSSCKKDKDGDECITCHIDLSDYGEGSYSITYCKDDPEEWNEYFDSWNDVVDYAHYMDAAYDFVSCSF